MATLVHNLDVIRQDLKAQFSGLEVGWIGDASHAAKASDHNPDSSGRVHAIDPMYGHGFGRTQANALVKALIGRKDLAYVIHNGTIWSASHGWAARTYTGTDKHTTHVHVSGLHTDAARKTTKHLPNLKAAATPAKPAVLAVDGKLGPATIKALQKALKVTQTGSFGAATTKALQRLLGVSADGDWGPKTTKALQKRLGVTQDGDLGPVTIKALQTKLRTGTL